MTSHEKKYKKLIDGKSFYLSIYNKGKFDKSRNLLQKIIDIVVVPVTRIKLVK